jgi:nuclear pore complex protein Nup133
MLDHRHALLAQDKVYSGLVSRFFESRNYPELAWMHHLSCKRYGEAASDLLVVDKLETDLAQKHVSSFPIYVRWLSDLLVAE